MKWCRNATAPLHVSSREVQGLRQCVCSTLSQTRVGPDSLRSTHADTAKDIHSFRSRNRCAFGWERVRERQLKVETTWRMLRLAHSVFLVTCILFALKQKQSEDTCSLTWSSSGLSRSLYVCEVHMVCGCWQRSSALLLLVLMLRPSRWPAPAPSSAARRRWRRADEQRERCSLLSAVPPAVILHILHSVCVIRSRDRRWWTGGDAAHKRSREGRERKEEALLGGSIEENTFKRNVSAHIQNVRWWRWLQAHRHPWLSGLQNAKHLINTALNSAF